MGLLHPQHGMCAGRSDSCVSHLLPSSFHGWVSEIFKGIQPSRCPPWADHRVSRCILASLSRQSLSLMSLISRTGSEGENSPNCPFLDREATSLALSQPHAATTDFCQRLSMLSHAQAEEVCVSKGAPAC